MFGGAPNDTAQAQNILLAVRSCTCTSSPMTVSWVIRDQGLRRVPSPPAGGASAGRIPWNAVARSNA